MDHEAKCGVRQNSACVGAFLLCACISGAVCAQQGSGVQLSVPIEVLDADRATPRLVNGSKIQLPGKSDLAGPRAVAKIAFVMRFPTENAAIQSDAESFFSREVRLDPLTLSPGTISAAVRIHLLPSNTAFTYQSSAKYLGVLKGNSNTSVDRALAFFSSAYEDWDKNRTYDEYGYKIWRNYGRVLHNACIRDLFDTCASAAEILRNLAGTIGLFEPDKLKSESGLSMEMIKVRLEREALEAEQVPLRRALRVVKQLGESRSAKLGDAIVLGQAILDQPPASEVWQREGSSPEQLRRDLADYRVKLALQSEAEPATRVSLLKHAIQDYEILINVRKEPSDKKGQEYAYTLLQQQP